jgi:hypothetical protein
MSYNLFRVNTDLFDVNNIVQTVGVVAGKSLLIDTLRDVFREDREFKFVQDAFGFPLLRGELGLSPDAGLNDEEVTRILIGSTFYYNVKFYPSITVKNTSSKYMPVSFNQDWLGIVYRKELVTDAYGNNTMITVPAYNTLVGAWEQDFEVKITTESEIDREELADIVSTVLIGPRRRELQDAGLFIKSLSHGGEAEEPYGNGHLYTTSIRLETRSEFKLHIPISNVVERIGFIVNFGNIETGEYSDALAINSITVLPNLP